MTRHSAIYQGDVVHERLRPKTHRLRYKVFSLLLDIDELSTLDRDIGLFGYNRAAPVSFHDRDHGPLDGAPLRPWVEAQLRNAGLSPDGGAIRLLCYPRIFGYVFNPLSVFFCYRQDGALQAILYEVCNTYKERHTYVLPAPADGKAIVRQRCAKALYVSPFIAMDCDYHFRIRPPAETINVVIRQEDSDGLLLAAAFQGDRQPMTGRVLARKLAAFPLLTLKIIVGIHWEALRLWMKGLKVYSHVPADQPKQSNATPTNALRQG